MSGLLLSIVTAPLRAVRALWHFVDPPLKAGRIPLARALLVLQAVAALTFIGYTMVKKDVRLPFSPEPYYVDVMFSDAQGLFPPKEPGAGVAGVPVGKVVEVEVEDGQGRATLRLDSEMRGKIFNDATAQIRPTSVLQTLIVNILPGDPASGELADGRPIPAGSTQPFVHIDDLTGVLDADTQAQVQVLIQEAARALDGRESELRQVFGRLGELTDAASPLAEALADRRHLLTRLTGNLDELFATLGDRGAQLARAIDLGSRTLEVTADREPELAATVRNLGPVLEEADRALSSTQGLAGALAPALDQLVPVAPQVGPTAEGLSRLAPSLDRLVGTADGLIEDASRPVRLFADGTDGLAQRVRDDQTPALMELVDLVDLLFEYRHGLVQFAEVWSGVTSTTRNSGPSAQFAVVTGEVTPESFGLGPEATRSVGGEPPRLSRLIAEALERTCRDVNPGACLARFSIPGLPAEPVLEPDSGEGEEG